MSEGESDNPEIGRTVIAAGLATNFHDVGRSAAGEPSVVLLHGSGPGVTG